MDIEMARLLCLKAAWMMDQGDPRAAAPWISKIKVVAPQVALKVTDEAVQMFGWPGRIPGHHPRPLLDGAQDAQAGGRAGRRPPAPGGAAPNCANTPRSASDHEGHRLQRFRGR